VATQVNDERVAKAGEATSPPDGFVPYGQTGPFIERIGPLYERKDGGGLVFGLRVVAHHCNRRGFAHGGLLATLADIALGKTCELQIHPDTSLLTTSIAYDFIGSAQRGEWIEVRSDFQRIGRAVCFANCYIRAEDRVIGRANGIFKVVKRARGFDGAMSSART
jgi:acyl-coenzyme A thioesterase 13